MKFALNAYYWPKRSLIFLYIAKIWCVSRFGGLFTQHICKVYKRRVLTWMTVIVNVTDTAWKVSQIRSFFWSVFSCIRTEYWDLQSKYRPEKTPYLDTFKQGRVTRSLNNDKCNPYIEIRELICQLYLHYI